LIANVKKFVDLPVAAKLLSHPGDFVNYLRNDNRRLHVRALDGKSVEVRGHTSDRKVLRNVFGGSPHLPPGTNPQFIWDLGANIGLTVAHIAVQCPDAHIVGVEMEPANAAIAKRNIKPWNDRAEILEAAVWTSDGEIFFDSDPGREAGHRITTSGKRATRAISLNSLVAKLGQPDYVKMDIEGAERDVLRTATKWAEGLAAISVEVHGSFTVEECIRDLVSLGFEAHEQPQPWWPPSRGRPCVIGLRKPQQANSPASS